MTILLIEDNLDDRNAFQDAIKSIDPSIQLFTASNSWEALSMLNNFIPVIILMEINMPEMNGLEFIVLIRKNPYLRETPIILYSVSSQHYKNYEVKQGLSYIIKQPSVNAIVESLKSVITNH